MHLILKCFCQCFLFPVLVLQDNISLFLSLRLFFFFFSFWVRSRCGWLRGFVDFITRRIFRGMKLNANSEQIEGKLYFNIRGNFSLKLGWGRCLIKHVYTIIIIFKIFTPLLFSKCLKHFYFPSFQNVYTNIIIFFLLKIQRVYSVYYTPSVFPLYSKCFFTFFSSIMKHLPMYIFFPYICLWKKQLAWYEAEHWTHTKKNQIFFWNTQTPPWIESLAKTVNVRNISGEY